MRIYLAVFAHTRTAGAADCLAITFPTTDAAFLVVVRVVIFEIAVLCRVIAFDPLALRIADVTDTRILHYRSVAVVVCYVSGCVVESYLARYENIGVDLRASVGHGVAVHVFIRKRR